MDELLERLGRCEPEEIAAEVVADPPLIAVLLDAMLDGDEQLHVRASAAAEAAARERPELLAPHADALIKAARRAKGQTRANIAQMLARVELSDERAAEASDVLEGYLDEPDALSAIVSIANTHSALRPRARELVQERIDSDDEPLRERARLLLGQADSWPSGTGAS